MRRLGFLAAVLLGLAGCAVKEEGRECQEHSDCPSGQACGASGTCTKAAAACASAFTRVNCRIGDRKCGSDAAGEFVSECAGDGGGECSAWFDKVRAEDVCTAHQECKADSKRCGCKDPGRCLTASTQFCDSNAPWSCAEEVGTFCLYEVSGAACSSVRTCTADSQAGTASCQCNVDPGLCAGKSEGDKVCAGTGEVVTCRVTDGCPQEDPIREQCSSVRECAIVAGQATCGCRESTSCATPGTSRCNGTAEQVDCTLVDGCPQEVPSQCLAHTSCLTTSCQCIDDPPCSAGATNSYCSGNATVSCLTDPATTCKYAGAAEPCGALRTCTPHGPDATCDCPALGSAEGAGCPQGTTPTCSGDVVLQCQQPPGSTCFVWTRATDCGANGMTCGGGACVCRAVTDGVFVADPTSTGPAPTGAANPPECRFASIEAALAQANNALPAGTVLITGAPGTFTPGGALSIGPGVTVTTTEAPLGTASYAIKAPASLGNNTFIKLAAGATLSGVRVENDGGTGPALATDCLTGSTSPVLVDTVKISGAGTAANRFSAGLSHASPDCPVTLRNADVEAVGDGVHLAQGALAVDGGAYSGNGTHVRAKPTLTTVDLTVSNATLRGATDSAIVLDDVGSASAVRLVGNLVSRNQSTTPYQVSVTPSITRRAGGLVLFASVPTVFVVQDNTFEANAGDQVLVFVTGSVDFSGGADSTACGVSSNVFRCYDLAPWVGLYATSGATVAAAFNSWQNFPVSAGTRDFFGPVTGTNQSCTPVAGACP